MSKVGGKQALLIGAAAATILIVLGVVAFMLLGGQEQPAPMAPSPMTREEAQMAEAEMEAEAEMAKEEAPAMPEETPVEMETMKLTTIDGMEISLSDFRGKVVILWFMIPVGCPICQSQVESLKQVYEEYMDDVVVLAVTILDYQGVEDDMRAFASKNGVEGWYMAVDRVGLALEYDIIEMGVIVIGPDGKEVFRGIPMADYEELKNAIEMALQA